jgi:enoyl-[acyl-carrier-protein] reductase (NADH)
MMKNVFEIKTSGMTYEQFGEYLASTTHPRRIMALADVANVAAFVASDNASGMTGTTVNLTMGSLDD